MHNRARAGRSLVTVGVVGALLLLAGSARATPQDLFGFGARGPALAMTGVAHSGDYEAAYINPAGLVAARRRSLSFGFTAGVYRLKLDGARFPVEPSRGAVIGFELPLPFGGLLSDRLVLGGAFYTPADALLRGDVDFPEVPQFLVLERSQAASVQVGLGVDLRELTPGLSVGAALAVTASIVGDLFVRLDETGAFASQVESQLVASYAPIVGARWDGGDLGLGVVYRHELRGTMDLEVTVSDLPIDVPILSVAGVLHYDPSSLALEAFVRPRPDLLLVAHLTTRFWGAYGGPWARSSRSSNLAPDAELATVVSPRVAGEWTFGPGPTRASLRAGYLYEPSPAPAARLAPPRDRRGEPLDERVPMRLLDNDRHVLTAGLGVAHELGGGQLLRFDLFGQVHALVSRSHEIGASEDAAPMETGGVLFVGGWSMGVGF